MEALSERPSIISIVIPTFNCGKYICQAIESGLSQTYKNFEIIVVDDGSTDDTKSVLQPYIESGKIRYIYQENQGPGAARNRGIQEARGEYIAFLDSDDEWMPERLERSLLFLKKNSYDWVCSAFCRKVRGAGQVEIRRLDERSLADNGCDIFLLKNGVFYFSSVNIHMNTILAKKECFERVGLFNEQFRNGEDWDMWLRFEEGGLKGGYLDEPLAYYMIRKEGITKSGQGKQIDYHLQLAVKHAHILGLNRFKIRFSLGDVYFKYADIYFNERKNYPKALFHILKGFYYKPDIGRIIKGCRVALCRMLHFKTAGT